VDAARSALAIISPPSRMPSMPPTTLELKHSSVVTAVDCRLGARRLGAALQQSSFAARSNSAGPTLHVGPSAAPRHPRGSVAPCTGPPHVFRAKAPRPDEAARGPTSPPDMHAFAPRRSRWLSIGNIAALHALIYASAVCRKAGGGQCVTNSGTSSGAKSIG